MSLRASIGFPAACSGLMKCGVPRTVPSTVSLPAATGPSAGASQWTRPKSSNLATSGTPPRRQIMTFDGFTSRWMSPAACASFRAAHNCRRR